MTTDIRGTSTNGLPTRSTPRKRPRGRRPAEIGTTGLEVFGGAIFGDVHEHNREWFGKKRYDIVDRMRRGDATCAATLMAITLPIVSTDVIVEARVGADGDKPDPIVQEAADFIHYNLFELLDGSWNAWLREAFLYLAYGHYAFEKVFTTVKKGPYAGATGWKEFAPRHPRTFEEYYFDDHGHHIGVRQMAQKPNGGYIDVDLWNDELLWFTNQREGGNPLGASIYRPAWKHWKYKDGFYAVQAIAIERQGAGVPYGQYPEGTKSGDIDELEDMLQNVQAHEQSYLLWQEKWEVGFVDMGSSKVLDPKDAIDHHDSMIPQSILAGFLNLTKGNRGSFALSTDASGFFNYSIQNVASMLAGEINKKAIPELIDKNYPGIPSYPHLRFNKVGHISLEKIINGINQLGAEGFIHPTMDVENHVRGLLNLPAVDKAEIDEYERRQREREIDNNPVEENDSDPNDSDSKGNS